MKVGYVHPRRRAFTYGLCLMLCAVGAYSCLTHLFIYLDVEIFELNLLIEDLLVFAGYVLMAVGAYRVNHGLSGAGLGLVVLKKFVGVCTDLWFAEAQKTPEEICNLVFVDMGEIAGLMLSALFVLSELKAFSRIRAFAKKLWAVPVIILLFAYVGYLFANTGTFTDATVEMFLLLIVSVSLIIWCTNPAGVPRWIAQRIRENEKSGIN